MNKQRNTTLSILDLKKSEIDRRRSFMKPLLSIALMKRTFFTKFRQNLFKSMRKKYNFIDDDSKINKGKINELIFKKRTRFVSVFKDWCLLHYPVELIKKYYFKHELKLKYNELEETAYVKKFSPIYPNLPPNLKRIKDEQEKMKEDLKRHLNVKPKQDKLKRAKSNILDLDFYKALNEELIKEDEQTKNSKNDYQHFQKKSYKRDSNNNSVESLEMLVERIRDAEQNKKNKGNFKAAIKSSILIKKKNCEDEALIDSIAYLNIAKKEENMNINFKDQNIREEFSNTNKRSILITTPRCMDHNKLIKSRSSQNFINDLISRKRKFADTAQFFDKIKAKEQDNIKRSQVISSLHHQIKASNKKTKRVSSLITSDLQLPDVDVNNSDKIIFQNEKELKKYIKLEKTSPLKPIKAREMISNPDLYKNERKKLNQFVEKTKSYYRVDNNSNKYVSVSVTSTRHDKKSSSISVDITPFG